MPMFQVVSTIYIVSYNPNTYELCMLRKNKKRNEDVKMSLFIAYTYIPCHYILNDEAI